MYRARRHVTLPIILCVLALLLALAACGTNYSANGSSTSATSPVQPTASATHTSTGVLTTPTPTPTSTPSRNTATAYGCPGNQVIATAPPAATVTLATNANRKEATVNKGDTVNIDLPFGEAWAGPLNLSQDVLAMQSPAGDAFPAVKACVWHFVAVGSGTASLSFTGHPICQARRACPQYVLQPFQFVVTVASK